MDRISLISRCSFFCIMILSNLLLSGTLMAQSEKKLIAEADAYYKSEQYDEAAKLYRKVLAENDAHAYAFYQSGHCNRYLFKYALAEIHYNKAYEIAPKKYPLALFYLALMQKLNGRYTFAVTTFEAFQQKATSEEVKIANKEHFMMQAEVEKKGALLAIELREQPFRDFDFQNENKPLNSQYNDYAPTLGEADTILVLTSGRPGDNKGKINPRLGEAFGDNFRFKKVSSGWEALTVEDGFSNLNSALGDGAGTFSGDGKKFYFTSCNEIDDHCYIYVSEYLNREWQMPRRLDETINQPGFDSKQPALSPGGDTLFFVSNRKGGQGQNDIWMSVRQSAAGWGEPVNLGPGINTPFNEVSPFYYKDEQVFFFSSDGHYGLGGLDIFRVNLDDESSIVNLGRPFNSNYDDAYFYMGAERGFLASNRLEGKGGFDIYSFLPESKEAVIATILEHKPFAARDLYQSGEDFRFFTPQKTFYSELPIREQKLLEEVITASANDVPLSQEQEAFMAALDPALKEKVDRLISGEYINELAQIAPGDEPFNTVSVSGKLSFAETEEAASSVIISLVDASGEIAKTTTTNEDGSFRYTELPYDQSYRILVSDENNQLTQGVLYRISDLQIEGKVHAPLSKYFENIYFNFDSHKIRPEARYVLDDLLAFCKENPGIQVEINAFTDHVGRNAYNETLSRKRGQAVFDYLIAGGIDRATLVVRARGEIEGVANPRDPYQRQQSRRCEFILKGEIPDTYDVRYATYLIKPKTTLYSLGRTSGMSVDEIKQINGLTSNHIEAFRPIRLKKLETANLLVVEIE